MKSFVVAMVLLVGARAAEADITVERAGASLVGRDAAGTERWRVTHQLEDWMVPPTPVGPLRVGTRTVYAVAADLLELDVDAGQVVDRVRFPATIGALAATDEGGLIVTLVHHDDERRRTDVAVRYRLGAPAPGRGPWSNALGSQLQASADAESLVRDRAPAVALDALADAEARDATNPYLPLLRGQQLAKVGRTDEAREAFARAASLPHATWQDLLRISTRLEEAGQRAAARHAFERGLAGLRASGSRPERQRSLISLMVLYHRPERALAEAIRTGDHARVDELSDRAYQVCPGCEAARPAWTDLARWFESTGRGDLASKWRARARYARASIYGVSDRELAWLSAGSEATLVLLPLLAFVFGLRAGARRSGGRPLARDAAAWLAVLALGAVLHAGLAARVQVLDRHARANLALYTDAWDSPDLEAYLAGLPASDARDRLVAYARAERAATAAGTHADLAPPADVELDAAVTAGLPTPGLAPLARELDGGWLAAVLGALLVGLLAGLRFGARAEGVASWLPGGPRALAGLGGVVAVLGLTGVYVALGVPYTFDSSARDYFALGTLPVADEGPVGAIVLVVAAAVVHAGAIALDHRRARRAQILERCGRLG